MRWFSVNNFLTLSCLRQLTKFNAVALGDNLLPKVIREYYVIELETQEMKFSYNHIFSLWEDKSFPINNEFEKWLPENCIIVLQKSLIPKAILHTYNIFPCFAHYELDGRYKIDNNGTQNRFALLPQNKGNFIYSWAKKINIKFSLRFWVMCPLIVGTL